MNATGQPQGGPQHGICRCCGQPVALFPWMTCAEFDAMVCAALGIPRRRRPVDSLEYYKRHGIEMGSQEETLTGLAASYARKFTVAELADELFAVMQASAQRHGYGRDGPWTRKHALDIAARARRFTDRSDAAQARRDAQLRAYLHATGFFRWAEAATRGAQAIPGRQPGSRQPGARRAGARA